MLPEDMLTYLTNEDNVDSLVSILQYHVIADSLPSDSLVDGMMYATLNEGDSLYVRNATTPNGALLVNGILITDDRDHRFQWRRIHNRCRTDATAGLGGRHRC